MKRGVGRRELGVGIVVRNLCLLISNIIFKQRSLVQNLYSPLPIPHSPLPIDLQWFSDEDDQPGKTEEPTEHKLRKLREEGQVVKSQELVGALGLLLPAVLLVFLAPYMLRTCVEMVRFFFQRAVEMDPTKDRLIVLVFFRYLARLAAPILAVAVFSAVFSNMIQTGFLFTTKPITPDFSRVVPRLGQFFRRIISVDGLWNFAKSIIKMLIIGGVAFILIYSQRQKLLNLQKMDLYMGFVTVAVIARNILLLAAFLLLVLAIPDYMIQRIRFRQRHRMTRYEVKEELKQTEGDPMIQSRIRSRYRELMKQNLAAIIPKADVVITNPTHLAVALEYDGGADGPLVTAIGDDEIAARIRKIAEENKIPLVENKPLAWALYRETNVGDHIPMKYWNTVAAIFNKVWSINRERRLRMSA